MILRQTLVVFLIHLYLPMANAEHPPFHGFLTRLVELYVIHIRPLAALRIGAVKAGQARKDWTNNYSGDSDM